MTSAGGEDVTRRLVSRVDATIKTHKDPRQVVPRILHCSVDHPMAPAMRLVSVTLREVLSKYDRVLKDSAHLVRSLRKIAL